MNCQSAALFLKTQVVSQFYLQSKVYICFLPSGLTASYSFCQAMKNPLVHDLTHFSPLSSICCFFLFISFAIIAHLTINPNITALAASASFNIIFIVSLMGTDPGALCSLNLSAVVVNHRVSYFPHRRHSINCNKMLKMNNYQQSYST